MRKIILILSFVFLVCSCRKETMADGRSGWLCIEDISVGGWSAKGTRGVVDSDFSISILDGGGALVQEFAAGSVPSKIALPAGNYTLSACSSNINDWKQANSLGGAPAYRDDVDFTIESEMYCYVKITAPMVNYGIRFSVDEGLNQWFTQFSLSADGTSGRSLSLLPGVTGWFEDETITVSLNATNTDGDSFKGGSYKMTPKKGHRYTFRYSLSAEESNNGSASLSISVDDEFSDGGEENIEVE